MSDEDLTIGTPDSRSDQEAAGADDSRGGHSVTRSYGFGTRSIHAEAPDPVFGAHGVPIYQNAAFKFQSVRSRIRIGSPLTTCSELQNG